MRHCYGPAGVGPNSARDCPCSGALLWVNLSAVIAVALITISFYVFLISVGFISFLSALWSEDLLICHHVGIDFCDASIVSQKSRSICWDAVCLWVTYSTLLYA